MSTRWTEVSLRTAHVPWTHQNWREVAAALTDAVNAFAPSSTKPAEFARHLVALAVGINVAERTLPSIDKDLAIALVKEYLADKATEPATVPWNAEGTHNSTAATERQLYQTCAAAKYLLRDNANVPLSKDLVVETHALLMKGSVNDDGSPVVTNRMRRLASESVGAGTYTFVPPRHVHFCAAAGRRGLRSCAGRVVSPAAGQWQGASRVARDAPLLRAHHRASFRQRQRPSVPSLSCLESRAYGLPVPSHVFVRPQEEHAALPARYSHGAPRQHGRAQRLVPGLGHARALRNLPW
jgi:hypothetical protein